MIDRVWRAMLAETGDGRWELTCPSPRDPAEAAAQGRALARALAAYPERAVVCRVPIGAPPLVTDVLGAAGLAPLADAIWVSRRPWDGDPPPWPDGLDVITAAEVGYGPLVAAVPRVQAGTLDWPELLAAVAPGRQLDALRAQETHRPDWWFLVSHREDPVGIVLFDGFSDEAHHMSFAGVVPERRRVGLVGRLLLAGFARLPRAGLVGAVDARNTPSRRMLARVGFVEDGAEAYWHRPPTIRATAAS